MKSYSDEILDRDLFRLSKSDHPAAWEPQSTV
jgi:hypothetical protein